jgi:RNA polymerase sigma-B factor
MLIHSGDTRSRARLEQRLFSHYRRTGDPAARAQLVERFLPLARSLARRYQHGAEPLDDLMQVASLGLLKAIDRYDPERGIAFSSYAVPTIAGELKRHFRDHGWAMRVPRELQERALRVEREQQRLAVDLGRSPTAAEVAAALGVEVEQIVEARGAASGRHALSLDMPRDADDDEPAGEVAAEELGFAAAEDAATFEQLAAGLSAREREVLQLRFGEDLTQSEIGERVGCSQMHVSRMLRATLARLQEAAGLTAA